MEESESFLVVKSGKKEDFCALIGGCWCEEVVDRLTGSGTSNVVGQGYIICFLWLVLNWKQGQNQGSYQLLIKSWSLEDDCDKISHKPNLQKAVCLPGVHTVHHGLASWLVVANHESSSYVQSALYCLHIQSPMSTCLFLYRYLFSVSQQILEFNMHP